MNSAKLTILYQDNSTEEIAVKRVSNISTKVQALYYEVPGNMPGQGKVIPLSDIKCWELETA